MSFSDNVDSRDSLWIFDWWYTFVDPDGSLKSLGHCL